MGDETKIEWTDKTWNPWRGCTKVSPGCDRCYMFAEQRRYGKDPEVVTRCGPQTFSAPLRWHRKLAEGERRLVFTSSWTDFFHKDADEWRDEAWDIIRRTPSLTYQILTKRPSLIESRLPSDWGPNGYPNVWLVTSAENQEHADRRIPILLKVPAVVHGVSAEPMLGPIDFDRIPRACFDREAAIRRCMKGPAAMNRDQADAVIAPKSELDWIIVGGESQGGARPFDFAWARSVIAQCRVAGVACFVKQGGDRPLIDGAPLKLTGKGGDMSEWPEDVRVREYPEAS